MDAKYNREKMKSLGKRKSPGRRGSGPARKRFSGWLAAPLVAGLILGCNMAGQSPGGNHNNAPDAGPVCETTSYERPVNSSSTQRVEQTRCDGVLEMEVTTFTPPLQNDTHRKALDLVDSEHILLNGEPTIVLLGSEALRATLQAGDSVEYQGYTITVDSIDGEKAYITIKDSNLNVLEEGAEVGPNQLWYTFYVGNNDVILLDVFGISDTAELSLFYGRLDGGVLVASDRLNDGTLVTFWSGSNLVTPDGEFSVEPVWEGDRLVGWTLSRE